MWLSARSWKVWIWTVCGVLFTVWTFRVVGDARAYFEARALITQKKAEIESLRAQLVAARTYVYRLQNDRATHEQLVRQQGYVRPDEKLFIVPTNIPKPVVERTEPTDTPTSP